jgi:hypothetical protein
MKTERAVHAHFAGTEFCSSSPSTRWWQICQRLKYSSANKWSLREWSASLFMISFALWPSSGTKQNNFVHVKSCHSWCSVLGFSFIGLFSGTVKELYVIDTVPNSLTLGTVPWMQQTPLNWRSATSPKLEVHWMLVVFCNVEVTRFNVGSQWRVFSPWAFSRFLGWFFDV